MDGARIQALVYRGYALSASRVGVPHQHYRPSGTGNPLAPGNLLGSLPAAFSVDRYKFAREDGYGTPEHQVLADGGALAVGDYLVGPSGTFFIGDLMPLVPILAVECNSVLTVSRPTSSRALGRVPGIDGDMIAAEIGLQVDWPASLLQGTKGEKSDSGIPGDSRLPWWAVLMPAVPGVAIETDDVMTDADGRRYQVSSAELTSKGWRITAQLAEA